MDLPPWPDPCQFDQPTTPADALHTRNHARRLADDCTRHRDHTSAAHWRLVADTAEQYRQHLRRR